MAEAHFGLMMRATQPDAPARTIHEFNLHCIHALAETKAFTTLWMEDHLQVDASPVFESLTTLSYLAGQFTHLNIGTLVTSQSYRSPSLLAKMAANLQFLTQGRLTLGLGTGWKADEYAAYGYNFPSTQERFEQLEDAIHVIRAMWTMRPATWVGAHYGIHQAYCEPQPVTAIPLLIGGGGELRTLRLVAKHADYYNYNSCTAPEYAHKLSVLHQHCEAVGRSFDQIGLTFLATISIADNPSNLLSHPSKHYLAGSPGEVIRELEQFCRLGVRHFMLRIPNEETLRWLVHEVLPHFA